MSVCLCAEKRTGNMDSIMVMCHLLPLPFPLLRSKEVTQLDRVTSSYLTMTVLLQSTVMDLFIQHPASQNGLTCLTRKDLFCCMELILS